MKKGQRRKTELLKIAYRLFSSGGYENTSVDDIIDEAGIAKGTYYYYFQSKEQMLEEVIDMMLDAEEENARRIIEKDIPVPQKIIGIISSFRPTGDEEAIKDALHKAENIIMHEKTKNKLTERLVPLLTEVAMTGVKEGIFDCTDIPERVKEIVILANELFDDGSYTSTEVKVFIDTVERILYARSGTMDIISSLMGE